MSSYRKILYHIVFRTKDSRKTITQEHARELYAYIMGFIKNKNGFLYRINGMEEHIHILCDLHPTIALADFMRDMKSISSGWIKETEKFPEFKGWADGYAAFTYAWKDKDMIVNYIKNQQEHHKKETFEEELKRLLEEFGIEYDEKYFP
jgi:REP element-mobilizing transposase RayT